MFFPVKLRKIILAMSLSALLLAAAEPAWKTKEMATWTQQDAYALLSDSPWVRRAAPPVSYTHLTLPTILRV